MQASRAAHNQVYRAMGRPKYASDKVKKTGSFRGKSNKLGGGGRFAQLVAGGKSPALAAFIGRKKYGAKKMASMAAKGRKRHT